MQEIPIVVVPQATVAAIDTARQRRHLLSLNFLDDDIRAIINAHRHITVYLSLCCGRPNVRCGSVLLLPSVAGVHSATSIL